MSDEVFPTATRQIDIPARFIRQAIDHIEHTGSRYVTFLFTGEQVIDAICVGVTTRLLITDQRRTPPPRQPADATATAATVWTLETLTDEVLLDQVREHGPIGVKHIGDNLGIVGSDISLRQRIRRGLRALTEAHLIHKIINPGAFPTYGIVRSRGPNRQPPPKMPIRPGQRVTRKDITDEKVIALIQQHGRISSRTLGDLMSIPRPDNLVRGKITQVMHDLVEANRIRIIEGQTEEGGGRLYEMMPETVAEASEV